MGVWEEAAATRMTLPDPIIAAVTWAANAEYCRQIGDRLQPRWDDAEEWERRSAIAGVQFHREHPDATDAECHDERMVHERAAGWRLGTMHDEDNRRSPYMVEYDELPEKQRVKYRLFRGIVRALMK